MSDFIIIDGFLKLLELIIDLFILKPIGNFPIWKDSFSRPKLVKENEGIYINSNDPIAIPVEAAFNFGDKDFYEDEVGFYRDNLLNMSVIKRTVEPPMTSASYPAPEPLEPLGVLEYEKDMVSSWLPRNFL